MIIACFGIKKIGRVYAKSTAFKASMDSKSFFSPARARGGSGMVKDKKEKIRKKNKNNQH